MLRFIFRNVLKYRRNYLGNTQLITNGCKFFLKKIISCIIVEMLNFRVGFWKYVPTFMVMRFSPAIV